ncbi:MAG: response regulator [Rhodocyclales bacterium]|nr:response regulator [Rhodocyclales bacterium]
MTTEADQNLPRVLIIDDSRMVRASIIRHIRDRFDVREEADGEAGWQTLLVDPTIQVVITDIGMPRLDGYGVLDRIRSSRLSRISTLPVVVISGDDEPEVRARAKNAGATDFISKSIGNVELLARLEALTQLAQTQLALEKSRAAALANASNVESAAAQPSADSAASGASPVPFLRPAVELAVVVIEIDQFERLVSRYGAHVAQLINRKLSMILATKLRKEDSVAELQQGRFAVVSPKTNINGASAFALRLRHAIEHVVMTYREERIRIQITIGIASTDTDRVTEQGPALVNQLMDLAIQRIALGRASGGNRVVSEGGEVLPELMDRPARAPVSIDQLLLQVKSGVAVDEKFRQQLLEAIRTLAPLLELVESEIPSGLSPVSLARAAHAG